MAGHLRTERQESAVSSAKLTAVAYVYLLRCGDDSLYCGWTTDLERRLAAHRSGAASRYTRSRRPVDLVFVSPAADRSAALREEARIKRLPRAAKLRLIGSGDHVDLRADAGRGGQARVQRQQR
ncbi:MAG: Excinuclease subunit domain protein [Solirubrobacterales bacterium]|nr:Excinuclease subunit domain protein [Solirubrobacterales bacterium]